MRGRARLHADACVDGDAAVRHADHGVEVELGNLGQVLGEPREALDEVDEGGRVGGRRAAVAADEPPGLAAEDQLLRLDVGEWRDPA